MVLLVLMAVAVVAVVGQVEHLARADEADSWRAPTASATDGEGANASQCVWHSV